MCVVASTAGDKIWFLGLDDSVHGKGIVKEKKKKGKEKTEGILIVIFKGWFGLDLEIHNSLIVYKKILRRLCLPISTHKQVDLCNNTRTSNHECLCACHLSNLDVCF
ncbi:hypothetical protein Dimus_001425 [Dionaea muscipula]